MDYTSFWQTNRLGSSRLHFTVLGRCEAQVHVLSHFSQDFIPIGHSRAACCAFSHFLQLPDLWGHVRSWISDPETFQTASQTLDSRLCQAEPPCQRPSGVLCWTANVKSARAITNEQPQSPNVWEDGANLGSHGQSHCSRNLAPALKKSMVFYMIQHIFDIMRCQQCSCRLTWTLKTVGGRWE